MAATKLEVVNVSTERLLKQIKLANMCMQDVTRATGTSMWTITKRCKTTVTTAQAVADVLHCKVADLMPPMTESETQSITADMLLGPECHERASCFARSSQGRCKILTSTYGRCEKACPFRKKRRKDRT